MQNIQSRNGLSQEEMRCDDGLCKIYHHILFFFYPCVGRGDPRPSNFEAYDTVYMCDFQGVLGLLDK